MNPYVYSRKKGTGRKAKAKAEVVQPSAGGLVKAVFGASVSPAIALAIVIFAAGSTASMAAIAYPELSAGVYSPVAIVSPHVAHAQVLGDSTSNVVIDDSALEAGDPSASITAKPVSFDSTLGRWDYSISYQLNNLTAPATLTIGTYVVQDGITSSNSSETGAILKPNTTYHISLWTGYGSGTKQKISHIDLRTSRQKTTGKNNNSFEPCMQPQSSSSSTPPSTGSSAMPGFCIKDTNGAMQCAHQPCGSIPQNHPAMGQPMPVQQGQAYGSSTSPNGMPPMPLGSSPGNQQSPGLPPPPQNQH